MLDALLSLFGSDDVEELKSDFIIAARDFAAMVFFAVAVSVLAFSLSGLEVI